MCARGLLVSCEIHNFYGRRRCRCFLLMINAYIFFFNHISFVVHTTMCVCHARDAITLSFITYYRRQLGRSTLSFNLSRLQFYDFPIFFFVVGVVVDAAYADPMVEITHLFISPDLFLFRLLLLLLLRCYLIHLSEWVDRSYHIKKLNGKKTEKKKHLIKNETNWTQEKKKRRRRWNATHSQTEEWIENA